MGHYREFDCVPAASCLYFGAALVLGVVAPSFADDAARPQRYVLNYPVAQQFCPPVETYFDDVTQAIQRVGGRTIRHQLNGGYGLPVVDKVGDQHLLHLGSDVAWYQVGEPVHAIASGVVRLSIGPPTAAEAAKTAAQEQKKSSAAGAADDDATDSIEVVAGDLADLLSKGGQVKNLQQMMPFMGWGNLIVIEHHLPDDSYVTSVYGHLSFRRLVAAGDIVQAGQAIGFEGRSGIENGGYKPHLHLGIREGRMFEPGARLWGVEVQGAPAAIKLVSLGETELEIEASQPVVKNAMLKAAGHEYPITSRDDKQWLSAGVLNYLQQPDFAIVGYDLSTKGWRDPTEFLRQMSADVAPAPFGPIPKAIATKPRQ